MARSRLIAAVVMATLTLPSCRYPRDTVGTLDHVRGGDLRVGVIANPPWVVIRGDTVTGVEATMIASLAKQLGSRVVYSFGSEQLLFGHLNDHALDVVIGGLNMKDPRAQEAAFTRPFYTDSILIAAPEQSTLAHDFALKSKHVWALPLGENEWLVTVEKHLRANEQAVPAMLRALQ